MLDGWTPPILAIISLNCCHLAEEPDQQNLTQVESETDSLPGPFLFLIFNPVKTDTFWNWDVYETKIQ